MRSDQEIAEEKMEEYGVFAPLPFEVDLFPIKKANRKANKKAKVSRRIPKHRGDKVR